MFTSDDPQWRKVYNLLVAANVDDVVTYDELGAAFDGDFRGLGRPGLDKAVKVLQREDSRTVECERGKGYRIVRAGEHERLARGHQKRARRQVGKAKGRVTSADRSQLNSDECRRLDDLETNLAQQSTILRRTTKRVEEVDAARKKDKRDVSEELAMLNTAVERLQKQINAKEPVS